MTESNLENLEVPNPETVTVLGDTPAPDKEPVVFSDRQQALVDHLIKESQGRAARELRTRVTELEKERGLLLDQVNGKEPNADEISRLKASIADEKLGADRATQQAEELSKKAYQQALAQKFDIIDTDVATTMLKDSLRFDPELKTYVATNPDGTTRLNADGTPITGEKLYQEFSNAKPWLVKGSVVPGSGSTRSQGVPPPQIPLEHYFGASSSAAAVNKLSLTRPDEYKRLRRLAISKGLI